MKAVLAAVLVMSMFGLSRQANAETLVDILFPKAELDVADTGRPILDNAPTGSLVKPANLVTTPADRRPEKPSYPDAMFWSFQ